MLAKPTHSDARTVQGFKNSLCNFELGSVFERELVQSCRDGCDMSRLAAAFWSSCKWEDSRIPAQTVSQQSGSNKRMSDMLNVWFR